MGHYIKKAQKVFNREMERDAEWKRVSTQVKDRDGRCCRICDTTVGPFVAHHLYYKCKLWESPLYSMVCICEKCHEIHRAYVWTPQMWGMYGGFNTGDCGFIFDALLRFQDAMFHRGISIRQIWDLVDAIWAMTAEQWAEFSRHIPADRPYSEIVREPQIIVPPSMRPKK